MIKLEKSNEILEKRLKQVGDETDTDEKVNVFILCVCMCVYLYVFVSVRTSVRVYLCNFYCVKCQL